MGHSMLLAAAMVLVVTLVEWLMFGTWTILGPLLMALVYYFIFGLGLLTLLFICQAWLMLHGED